jgi:hypothetical protein
MRPHLSVTRSALMALIAGAAVMLWSAASFAGAPTVGPDCGSGASIVGSDSAGKVTVGSGSTCTLTFAVPYTNPPACTATNETNGGGYSLTVGTKSTPSGVLIGGLQNWADGDVISYTCAEY